MQLRELTWGDPHHPTREDLAKAASPLLRQAVLARIMMPRQKFSGKRPSPSRRGYSGFAGCRGFRIDRRDF